MKTDNTFESLLVNEQKELLRHAYALVGQREEAEELLQEVALRVLEKKDKFSLGTNFRGWVHRAMKSVFINMYRSKKRHASYCEPLDGISYHVDNGSFGIMETASGFNDMYRAINGMPDMYSIPFKMLVSGFKYTEIAEKLNLPIGTVKSRIFLARKRLQAVLADYK